MKQICAVALMAIALAGCATSPYGDAHTGFYKTETEYNAALDAERDAIVARLAAEAAQRPGETRADWMARRIIETSQAADRANDTPEAFAARMDAQDAANALRNAESVHYNTCRNNC